MGAGVWPLPSKEGSKAVGSLDPAGDLTDDVLGEGLRLLGELILAASCVPRHLTPEEVDESLGVDCRGPHRLGALSSGSK